MLRSSFGNCVIPLIRVRIVVGMKWRIIAETGTQNGKANALSKALQIIANEEARALQ